MRNVYPVTAPNERPAYSNVAFSLIAYSVEAVTGLTYEEQVQKYVAGPLGMTGTTPAPGDDAKGVIPPGETSWGTDYGFSTPYVCSFPIQKFLVLSFNGVAKLT